MTCNSLYVRMYLREIQGLTRAEKPVAIHLKTRILVQTLDETWFAYNMCCRKLSGLGNGAPMHSLLTAAGIIPL